MPIWLACACRRKLLLDIFQDSYAATVNDKCCDVCSAKTDGEEQTVDCKYELEILLDALGQIGCKGEVKIAEWIRAGSQISWTDAYDISNGNHRNRDMTFWRSFLKQCYVAGYIDLELKSFIKGNGYYSVQGVYKSLLRGRNLTSTKEEILFPNVGGILKSRVSDSSTACASVELSTKKSRAGKGIVISSQ